MEENHKLLEVQLQLKKFMVLPPHLHTITYPFREERHPTIALANRSALHRLCAWLWRKIENSCQAAFAKEFSIAGQQVMITACSMSALSKKTCSYPLPFVQRLMGK